MRFFFKIEFFAFRNRIFTLFLIAFVLTMSLNKSIVYWLKCMFKSRSFFRLSIWNIMSRISHEFLTIVSRFEYLLCVTIHLRFDHNDKKYYYNLNDVLSNCVFNNSIFRFQKYFSEQRDLKRADFRMKNKLFLNRHRTLRKRFSLQQ